MTPLKETQFFEQSIQINAELLAVDQTINDRQLMHQWLNPALRCDPIGEWSTEVGAKSRFSLKIPLLTPTLLYSTVTERRLGLTVWTFDGLFHGCDRWECNPSGHHIHLVNRFEFQIPNPIVAFGFNAVAAHWTQEDMKAQLLRLKQVAEKL